MSITDDRPTVRLGDWEPPQQYNQPHLEPSTGIRDVEHDVISGATVVQRLGEEPETYILRGDCFEQDLRDLAELTNEIVPLRHPVRSTDVLVRGVDGSHTGQYELVNTTSFDNDDSEYEQDFSLEADLERIQEEGNEARREWVYTYTVNLVEV